MFTATLFTKAKRWEQPQGPLMDKQITKTRSMCTVEHSSARQRKDVLTLARARMDLEDTTSQTQDKCVTVLYDVPRGVTFTETESRMVLLEAGTGNRGLFSVDSFSLGT